MFSIINFKLNVT